jgi:hypothetical protein
MAEGPLQNQEGVIHVKAVRLAALSDQALELRSHDFHREFVIERVNPCSTLCCSLCSGHNGVRIRIRARANRSIHR